MNTYTSDFFFSHISLSLSLSLPSSVLPCPSSLSHPAISVSTNPKAGLGSHGAPISA